MFSESGIGFLKCSRGPSMRLVGYPCRNVKSCSGHSPPLSQTGQSSGWLTRMNSRVASWPSAAFSDVSALRTTMPSWAVRVQAVWSFGMPSSSQRHIRHAPIAAPSRGS